MFHIPCNIFQAIYFVGMHHALEKSVNNIIKIIFIGSLNISLFFLIVTSIFETFVAASTKFSIPIKKKFLPFFLSRSSVTFLTSPSLE